MTHWSKSNLYSLRIKGQANLIMSIKIVTELGNISKSKTILKRTWIDLL